MGKLYVCKKLGINRVVFVYIAFLLFSIAAFRYEIGRDWEGYTSFFRNCLNSHSVSRFEPGFALLNKFFCMVSGNFYVMQFFIMTFCCVCVYGSFYRWSRYPVFTLFLYFVMYFLSTDMAQTRQHIAIAILLCGTRFVRERKLVLWIMVVILAMQFHVTALIAFPLYFTTGKDVSFRMAVFLYVICLITSFFGLYVIKWLLTFVISFRFVPERIVRIGTFYLSSKLYGQKKEGVSFLVNYVFVFLMLFFYFTQQRERDRYFLMNFFIGFLFQAMGRNFDQFSRIANYYLICGGGLCAYNLLIDCNKTFFKKIGVGKVFLCTIFLLAMLYHFYSNWTRVSFTGHSRKDDYTPYRCVLFEEIK